MSSCCASRCKQDNAELFSRQLNVFYVPCVCVLNVWVHCGQHSAWIIDFVDEDERQFLELFVADETWGWTLRKRLDSEKLLDQYWCKHMVSACSVDKLCSLHHSWSLQGDWELPLTFDLCSGCLTEEADLINTFTFTFTDIYPPSCRFYIFIQLICSSSVGPGSSARSDHCTLQINLKNVTSQQEVRHFEFILKFCCFGLVVSLTLTNFSETFIQSRHTGSCFINPPHSDKMSEGCGGDITNK